MPLPACASGYGSNDLLETGMGGSPESRGEVADQVKDRFGSSALRRASSLERRPPQ